jgi:hypothetical protein
MSNSFPVSLGKVEMITERPFTHTDHISKEREILVHMAKQLWAVLEEHPDLLGMSKSLIINEPDGRYHRYVVPRPDELSQKKMIYLVGFFSHRQKGATIGAFGDLDDMLVEQMPTFQEILSYSSMALPDGEFGNLVLLLNEEIKSKWMHGETHSKAVALAPGYYQFVRIHNGVLPQGVMRPDLLRITQVKYYDYEEDPPWKAVRVLSQG